MIVIDPIQFANYDAIIDTPYMNELFDNFKSFKKPLPVYLVNDIDLDKAYIYLDHSGVGYKDDEIYIIFKHGDNDYDVESLTDQDESYENDYDLAERIIFNFALGERLKEIKDI